MVGNFSKAVSGCHMDLIHIMLIIMPIFAEKSPQLKSQKCYNDVTKSRRHAEPLKCAINAMTAW